MLRLTDAGADTLAAAHWQVARRAGRPCALRRAGNGRLRQVARLQDRPDRGERPAPGAELVRLPRRYGGARSSRITTPSRRITGSEEINMPTLIASERARAVCDRT